LQLNRVIISGGGTGGHIFPAIAIADALKETHPLIEILFVGANGKMEMEKVPAAGYKIEGLNIAGLQRKLSLKNLILPFKIIGAVLKAGKIIERFKPQVVIGVGGYASAALVYAAGRKKIPVLIHEANSFPGKTNKSLAKYAQTICVAYPDMEAHFDKNKIAYTGNPVRKNIEQNKFTREQGIQHFGLDPHKKTILVIGGSQGALGINEGIHHSLPSFHQNQIQVIWQTGKSYYTLAREQVTRHKYTHIYPMEFIEKMNFAYAAADLVISRAGAMSVSELCICGKPSIFVPLPTAAEDHQTKNAMSLVNKNAAILVKNAEAKEKLGPRAIEILKDEQQLQQLSAQIQKFATYDAAAVIASEVLKLVK
jgi:UDP-N-acetylglucosamine--N-acetylmuramyl-(pentapeptide) pyrophosphoryl-undecaprenol N-acetylglucosamine transferase